MRRIAEFIDHFTRNLKLQHKLQLTFYFIGLLPFAVASVFYFFTANESLEKELGASVIEITKQVERQLGAFVSENEQLANLLRFDDDLQSFLMIEKATNETNNIMVLSNLRRTLRDLARMRLGLSAIYVVNDLGLYVYEAPKVGKFNYSFSDNTWYRNVLIKKESGLLPAHPQDYMDGNEVVSFVSRLTDYTDLNDRGTLIVDYYPEVISKMNRNITLGQTGYVFMLSAEGNPVIPNQPYPSDLIDSAKFIKEMNRESGFFSTEHEGQIHLLGFTTSDKTGWKIVGIVPFQEVAHEINHIRTVMTISGIVLVVLILFVAMYISQAIATPLKKLQEYMKVIETGDFTTRLVIERRDEIGMLEKKFNAMVARLNGLKQEVYLSKVREYQLKYLHKESELKSLQAQINPHFLYNTLNTMSCIGQVYQVEEVSVMSDALAGMFKYSIEGGRTTELSNELQHISDYMKIIQIRYPGMITCHLEVQEGCETIQILKLILQPIVENAILHGLLEKNSPGNIWILITKREKDHALVIRIVDDGVGMDSATFEEVLRQLEQPSENFKSIGLSNVKQRLFLHYGERGVLRFASERNRGTIVEMVLPIDDD